MSQDVCYYAYIIFLVKPLWFASHFLRWASTPRALCSLRLNWEIIHLSNFLARFYVTAGKTSMGINCTKCNIFSFQVKYPATMAAAMHPEGTSCKASWPYVEGKTYHWTWLFFGSISCLYPWLALHFLIVNVLGQQRLLRDPEVISYRCLTAHLHLLCDYNWP